MNKKILVGLLLLTLILNFLFSQEQVELDKKKDDMEIPIELDKLYRLNINFRQITPQENGGDQIYVIAEYQDGSIFESSVYDINPEKPNITIPVPIMAKKLKVRIWEYDYSAFSRDDLISTVSVDVCSSNLFEKRIISDGDCEYEICFSFDQGLLSAIKELQKRASRAEEALSEIEQILKNKKNRKKK